MGNDQVNVASQYPTATKIDNGVAYDISGKQLGAVKGMESDQDPFAGAMSAPAPEAAEAKTASEDPFAGSIAAPAPESQKEKPGFLKNIWDKVNTGLVSKDTFVRAMTGMTSEQLDKELAPYADETPTHAAFREFTRGVYQDLGGTASSFTSPLSIATYGAGAIGKAPGAVGTVSKAISGIAGAGFSAQGLEQMLDSGMSLDDIKKAMHLEGDPEKWNQFLQGAGMAVAGGAQVAESKTAFRNTKQAHEAAIKLHESSQSVFDHRMQELDVATKQADQASQKAMQARQEEQAGTGTRKQTIDAENTASKAVANAKKAQQALKEAGQTRADASIERDRLQRKVNRTQNQATAKQTSDHAAAKEDFMRAIPPAPSGPAFYEEKDYNIVRRYLEQHHESVEPVEGTSHAYDAFDHIQKDMENKVKPYVQKYSKDPISTNVRMDVRDKLVENPKANFADDGMKELEQYNLTDPTIEEADKIRKQLNDENRAILKKNSWDVDTALGVDPAFAARYYAAESIRNGEYGTFEHNGVDGIRETRQDEASVIKLRNAAWKQYTHGGSHVRGSGESGAIRKLAAKSAILAGAGTGAAVGYGTGIPLGGEFGAAAGAEIGRRLGRRIAPGDLTRDELVQRSMKVKGAGVPTTRITGPGLPSNPVPFGTPPPPSTAMSPEMMRHLMRENSPLHSDLATHYGEFSGNASYGELEQRFMDDIADKQKHSVPLESSEKQLLKDINQQNDADALAARKQAQEAAVKNEKPPVATLPEKAEPAMQISGLSSGMTTQRGLVHDLAHAIVADEVLGDKLPSLGIRSGLHEENMAPGSVSGKKGLASAAFDWTNFQDENGNIDLSKIKNHLDDIAAMYVAGGVANDIWHDMPYDHNHHLGADMTIMWKIMDKLGIPRNQQIKIIERAGERVVDILNRPGYREVLHDHAAVREPGLNEKMHFSPERIQQVVQDLKGEDNGQIKGKKSSTGNGESVGATERGTEKRTGTDEVPKAKRPVAGQLDEAVGSKQQRPSGAESKADEGNSGGTEDSDELYPDAIKIADTKEGQLTTTELQRRLKVGYGRASRILDQLRKDGHAGPENPKLSAEAVDTEHPIEKMGAEHFGYMRPDGSIEVGSRVGDFQTHVELADSNGEDIGRDVTHRSGGVKFGTGKKGGKGFIQIENTNPKTIDNAIKIADRLPNNEIDFEYWTPGTKNPINFSGTAKEVIGKIKRQFSGPQEFELHENPKLAAAAPPLEAEAEERLPKIKNLSVPPERTAGTYDAAIKTGGGVPGGIQRGDPEIDLPDLALFHDPTTGSTLALPVDKITPENVKEQLRKSRAQYIEAEDRAKNKPVAEHANDFNNIRGRQEIDSTVKSHNPEFAKRVADAYDQMQHNPNEPKTRAAYDQMKKDVNDQWNYATQQIGMTFEPWTKEGQPYANSKEMTEDVKNNKHLYFFQGGDLPADHPMKQIDPQTGYSYNDKLRAVHDLFGHAAHENQFGPKGGENAYLIHRQMFSPEAVPALTSETRGQNSWVNFGKHLRNSEGNVPFKGESGYVSPTERPYAQNKAGLLPEEFHGTGPGAWADQINLKTDPSGAIDPKTGSMVGKRYGFEVYPEAREILDHSPTAQDFRAFEQKNAGLLQKHPELRVGWDTLGDKPEINIGVSTDNLEAAKKAASALDQRSIWDTTQKKEIPTGGANKKQAFENYPLEQRLTGLNHVQPENPKLSTAVAEPEREETYHPDLQKLVDRFGTTTDPTKVRNGASFIAPNGKFINLGSVEHPVAIDQMTDRGGDPEAVGTKVAQSENTEIHDPVTNKFTPVDNRIGFMKDTGAIRTRFRDSISGRELVASVPAKGVTPEQIQALQQAVGQGLGRNGNLLIEVGESRGKSATKEFASPRDVEPMLREIGAMPQMAAENPKLDAADLRTGKEILDKAKDYFPVAKEPPERFYIHPDGRFLDASDSDHFAVSELYPGENFHDEDAINRFMDDTGALRGGLYEGSFLIHGGKIAPSDAQLSGVAKALREYSPSIEHKIMIETPNGSKELPEYAKTGEVRREIENLYKQKPENPKLAATVVRPKGSSVGLMDNPLKVKPTGELDRPSTIDVAMALNKFTKKSLPTLEPGKAEPEEMTQRAKSIMDDEARYQLTQNNTGESWYTKDMAEHDKTLQEMRPELDNPAKLSMFKMVEAVLSSGQKPYANFKSAVKAWDYYHEHGEFPPINPETGLSWGPRGSKGYSNAIEIINRLISEKGEQGASDWLLADHTVKELRGYNTAKSGGRGGGISGRADDVLPGVMVLGPKRGPFAQNLHGQESAFTADMWAARSWNRWMGTIELTPEGDEISTDRLRNEKERDLMKQSFGETANKLGISTSALQAVLWYYEQALYDAHGSPKESWSFSDAAKRASDEEFNSLKFGEPETVGVENPKLSAGPEALGQASTKTVAPTAPKVAGLIKPGNLNLGNRPIVQNDDGSHSSEYSVSFQDDNGHEVLVPTVVNGKFLTQDGKKPKPGSPEEKAMFKKAWEHYKQTGEHLGVFDTPGHADAYAQEIHNRKQELVGAEK